MKWTNKGHELERYRSVFEGKELLIYGAGDKGRYMQNWLKPICNIAGFIDRNKSLKERRDVPVYTLEELGKLPKNKYIIILAGKEKTMKLFAGQLLFMGYVEAVDFFYYEPFIDFYIFPYALYAKDKVYAPFISCRVANTCNLICEGCANCYDRRTKEEKEYSTEDIKRTIDALFAVVDVVNHFDLCGGEPALIKHFPEIIEYIGKNYRSRIMEFNTITNGTVVPSDEFCYALVKNHVRIEVDDYRDTVDRSVETLPKVCDKLEQYRVNYRVRKVDNWIDILSNQPTHNTEAEKASFFDECHNVRRTIHKGKLGLCDYAYYAYDAGAFDDCDNSESLSLWEKHEKSVVMEYLLGYSENGYCKMCGYCNGNTTINTHKIAVAKQVERNKIDE